MEFTQGTVGSFYKIEQLVNFFPKRLKSKIAVIIIGDGDKFEHLKDLIAQKDLNNFFILPSKNHQELKIILRYLILHLVFILIMMNYTNMVYVL